MILFPNYFFSHVFKPAESEFRFATFVTKYAQLLPKKDNIFQTLSCFGIAERQFKMQWNEIQRQ